MQFPDGFCTGRQFPGRGFTLIELMITLMIVAISMALAAPTFTTFLEKRRISSAAEDIVNFMNFAQSEAVKRNEKVTVSWYSPGGHNKNWCIGLSLGTVACDCLEVDDSDFKFCAIDAVPYRLSQVDFTDINAEFMHMKPNQSNFSFDPIRGLMSDIPAVDRNEILDNDYLFYMHSSKGWGSTRLYELQIKVNITGRITVCTDDDRLHLVGAYPIC